MHTTTILNRSLYRRAATLVTLRFVQLPHDREADPTPIRFHHTVTHTEMVCTDAVDQDHAEQDGREGRVRSSTKVKYCAPFKLHQCTTRLFQDHLALPAELVSSSKDWIGPDQQAIIVLPQHVHVHGCSLTLYCRRRVTDWVFYATHTNVRPVGKCTRISTR